LKRREHGLDLGSRLLLRGAYFSLICHMASCSVAKGFSLVWRSGFPESARDGVAVDPLLDADPSNFRHVSRTHPERQAIEDMDDLFIERELLIETAAALLVSAVSSNDPANSANPKRFMAGLPSQCLRLLYTPGGQRPLRNNGAFVRCPSS
jgi:hypothetical protein